MEIVKASPQHLLEIKKLSTMFQFEKQRNWESLLTAPNEMFSLILDGRIIGFTGLIYFDWNNTIQISNVFIHPNYRKQGLATKLVSYLMEKCKDKDYRCLIAEAPSLNAIKKVYEKLGFRKCGYNDRYYSNTDEEIAVWMSFDLNS